MSFIYLNVNTKVRMDKILFYSQKNKFIIIKTMAVYKQTANKAQK